MHPIPAPAIVFRICELRTEYLVQETPPEWQDKEHLGDRKAVVFPTEEEAWKVAQVLSTPEQRVHAVRRPVPGRRQALREEASLPRSHRAHRPYDPGWRNHVPNVGGMD